MEPVKELPVELLDEYPVELIQECPVELQKELPVKLIEEFPVGLLDKFLEKQETLAESLQKLSVELEEFAVEVLHLQELWVKLLREFSRELPEAFLVELLEQFSVALL